MKTCCRGEEVHNFGMRWSWMATSSLNHLAPQGKGPWPPLERRLCRHQSQCGCCTQKKNLFLPLLGKKPQSLRQQDHSLVMKTCCWTVYPIARVVAFRPEDNICKQAESSVTTELITHPWEHNHTVTTARTSTVITVFLYFLLNWSPCCNYPSQPDLLLGWCQLRCGWVRICNSAGKGLTLPRRSH